MSHPWISRKISEKIYQSILEQKPGVQIYLIRADAGTGKTYLARDLGVRIGSETGYGPGHKDNAYWSGILDLYDPETNNNSGIEKLLIKAFSDNPEIDFQDYHRQVKVFANMSRGGSFGTNLEDQRREIERAFASEMRRIARDKYLVWTFDTIERLQSALDPTEAKLGELGANVEDTASVVGWLLHQVAHLPRGTILLFGRNAERFEKRLRHAIEEANYDRQKTDGTIRLVNDIEDIDLSSLAEDEVEDFFNFRIQGNESLGQLLTNDLKKSLVEFTQGNPLLLDIALQTISETRKTDEIRDILDKKGSINEIGEILLNAYMNAQTRNETPGRRTLINHLTLARNGLFSELLQCLEPQSYSRLEPELEKLSELPFVKTRYSLVRIPSKDGQVQRKTYFLHDAMYIICDKVLLRPKQARDDCQRIMEWYQQKISNLEKQIGGHDKPAHKSEHRDDAVLDLLVESLFYRMRANPREGYQWYLKQADYALNAVETGLEMRLRDSIAQFSVNAAKSDDPKASRDSASSEIDQENIRILFPDFLDQFKIDSAMLWVKRLSFRGLHNDALKIAHAATWVRDVYNKDHEKYRLAFADFLLWKGQALMYSGKIKDAVDIYKENIKILGAYKWNDIKNSQTKYDKFEMWRIGHIGGMTRNNLGYTYWVYFGKYKLALTELNRALDYCRIAPLIEEEANTKDNMGRIHAMLWHEPASRLLIEDGLKKREEQRMIYRAALSRVSLASMQHRFGYWQLALDNIERALETFETLNILRGKGLARLTRAMIHRSMAESWRDQGISIEAAIEHIHIAIDDLLFAERIFKETIQERIRYVYALNELGSCYRTLYMLSIFDQASDEKKQNVYNDGVSYYSIAVEEAKSNDYVLEELDSKQDLAALYARAQKYEEALKELDKIRDVVPSNHQFRSGQKLDYLSEEEITDAYYKLMGQVEMLHGAIIFDGTKDETHPVSPSMETTLAAMEHYVLAVAYYYRYSSISSNTYVMATDRIYRRLSQCDNGIIEEIDKKYLPEWIRKYNIPSEWVTPLFSEIFVMLGA